MGKKPTADAKAEESDLNQRNQKLKNEKSKVKDNDDKAVVVATTDPRFRLITVRSLIINA